MMEAAALRRIVEAHFRVYDARDEKVRGRVAARLFFVMFPSGTFDERFESVKAAVQALDKEALVFMRRDGGEDILFVADRPEVAPTRPGLRIGLFLATLVTTVLSGATAWQLYRHPSFDGTFSSALASMVQPENLLWGFVAFALPLLLILGIHETAHYVTARRHGIRATPPMFIPAPPLLMPIGTFGAFISMKDPLPDRKALFDVGASGPLAGFLVAVPILVLGLFLTASVGQALPDMGHPILGADSPFSLDAPTSTTATLHFTSPVGTTSFNVTAPTKGPAEWLYHAEATMTLANGTTQTDAYDGSLARGLGERRTLTFPNGTTAAQLTVTWNDGLESFGDPLIVSGIQWNGHVYVPGLGQLWNLDGLLTHPTFFAGWVGMLVTGINLLPVSQLDGGHIARAALGDKARYAGWAAVALLAALTIFFSSWLLMAAFILYMGLEHPAPLNDRTKLGKGRLVFAVVMLVVFLLTFVPVPLLR